MIPVNYEQEQNSKRLTEEEHRKLREWTSNYSLDSVEKAKEKYQKNMVKAINRMKKKVQDEKEQESCR